MYPPSSLFYIEFGLLWAGIYKTPLIPLLPPPTHTCWKRRSSPGSFSMVFLNLSVLLAPMQRSSPRDRKGFSNEPPSIMVAP